MSKHKDHFSMIDRKSRARVVKMHPAHRAEPSKAQIQAGLREDMAYVGWCSKHDLDPADPASAIAYEQTVGFLFIEAT
jgi:hypothetical protein